MITLRNILTRIPLFFRVVSLYAAIGLAFVVLTQIQEVKNVEAYNVISEVQKTSVVRTSDQIKPIVSGEPISINMERLDISLPIKNGSYDKTTGEWALSDDAAFFAQMTSLPNSRRGSTFIYGHNNKRVLGRLSGLVVGDIVNILTSNGHTFSYVYTHDAIVPPDLTTVLYDNPESPRLIIMTCEGIWSQARRLMYFSLQEVV